MEHTLYERRKRIFFYTCIDVHRKNYRVDLMTMTYIFLPPSYAA